jgi:parvulin-like peptidyl-prolyl isomerase
MLLQLCAFAVWAGEVPGAGSRAATVNGTGISVQEFQRELDRLTRQKGIRNTSSDTVALAGLKREALENLIVRELLYQECLARKIFVEPAAIDREITQAKGQFPSLVEFSENLRRLDMTEGMVRDQVARGLAIKILIDRSVARSVTASEDEVTSYFEQHRDSFTRPPQVRLSHILIAVDAAWPKYNKKEAEGKLSGLQQRIMNGEDFAALAAANSDCQSKAKGGDIGWFAPGQLSPEMEIAVAQLKVGELSGIVEDKFGLHLIKVVDRSAEVTAVRAEVSDKIRRLVRQEKDILNLQRFVKNLRDAARVEITLVVD